MVLPEHSQPSSSAARHAAVLALGDHATKDAHASTGGTAERARRRLDAFFNDDKLRVRMYRSNPPWAAEIYVVEQALAQG